MVSLDEVCNRITTHNVPYWKVKQKGSRFYYGEYSGENTKESQEMLIDIVSKENPNFVYTIEARPKENSPITKTMVWDFTVSGEETPKQQPQGLGGLQGFNGLGEVIQAYREIDNIKESRLQYVEDKRDELRREIDAFNAKKNEYTLENTLAKFEFQKEKDLFEKDKLILENDKKELKKIIDSNFEKQKIVLGKFANKYINEFLIKLGYEGPALSGVDDKPEKEEIEFTEEEKAVAAIGDQIMKLTNDIELIKRTGIIVTLFLQKPEKYDILISVFKGNTIKMD